jgi:hypothetical protein
MALILTPPPPHSIPRQTWLLENEELKETINGYRSRKQCQVAYTMDHEKHGTSKLIKVQFFYSKL